MCDSVRFLDGDSCSTQGELKKKLGGPLIIDSAYSYTAIQEDMCLCPIDLDKTAQQNGYTASKEDAAGEYDPFDTWFYK